MKEQNDKINQLRKAKLTVLKHYDILLIEEEENLYYNALNSLNMLINHEIEILNTL
jgi:hypothetical protein